MRKSSFILLLALAGLVAWYVSWSASMKPHVERVEKTIAHYNERFKTSTYRATFKAQSIHASGFPFSRSITIENPNLAMVWGRETYAVEASYLTLQFEDEAQGRYSVILPGAIEALYSEEGKAPEAYRIAVSNGPGLWARVKDTPPRCNDESCKAKPEELLSEIGFQLHGDILLDASLGERNEKIGFKLMALPKPLFMPIPNDPARPVSLFIGMLREELVFQ